MFFFIFFFLEKDKKTSSKDHQNVSNFIAFEESSFKENNKKCQSKMIIILENGHCIQLQFRNVAFTLYDPPASVSIVLFYLDT